MSEHAAWWSWSLFCLACSTERADTAPKLPAHTPAALTAPEPAVEEPAVLTNDAREAERTLGRALLGARDAKGAAEAFERACTGGDLPSCVLLADLLDAGRGVPEDGARAAQLYQRACAGGLQGACDQLGH